MADLPNLTLPLPAPDLVARVNSTENRVAALEEGGGSGLAPDPDYPGYYVIDEGGGGGPVDYPPTITLGVSEDGLDVTATFTASDPEGAPVTVKIAWGDGQTTDPATSPTTHTYATGGTYTVTATATAGGKTGTDTATVTVQRVVAPGEYSAAVLADSPYVYMPFTEESAPFLDATGTVTPSSVGTHEATPGGQALGTLPRSAGFSITSGQQATYSIGALPGSPTAASVEFVTRPWSLSGSATKIIHGGTVEASNTGVIRIWNGSGWVTTPTGVVATGGVITHVVAVWTATDVKIYINGVEQASSASTAAPGSVTEWAVGGPVPAAGVYYRGYLAGVAFYDRALTQTEAADHFAALGIGA